MTPTIFPLAPLAKVTSKIGSGATPRGGERAYSETGTPLIRSMNVYDLCIEREGLAFIDDEQAASLDHVTVAAGDVLINITGASVARCCLAPAELAGARVNQHVAIVRTCPEVLDGRFLSYWLVAPGTKAHLLSLARAGGTREALTKGGLERFLAPVPEMPVQRRISSILGAYDDLIEVNRRRIALLEGMARRLFDEWFVHFRFPGHDAGSQENGLPIGWRRVAIRHAYEGLFDGPHATPPPSDNGPVFLGIGNLTETGRLDLSSVRHISEADFPRWTKRVTPREGDIVFTYEATLNRYALIPRDFRGCLGRRLALIRADTASGINRYLYLYFFTPAWREVITRNTLSGATVDRIPLSRFPEFPVVVPTDDILTRFDKVIAPIFEQLHALGRSNHALARSRDLLLPRLMSGELSVAAPECELEAAA